MGGAKTVHVKREAPLPAGEVPTRCKKARNSVPTAIVSNHALFLQMADAAWALSSKSSASPLSGSARLCDDRPQTQQLRNQARGTRHTRVEGKPWARTGSAGSDLGRPGDPAGVVDGKLPLAFGARGAPPGPGNRPPGPVGRKPVSD